MDVDGFLLILVASCLVVSARYVVYLLKRHNLQQTTLLNCVAWQTILMKYDTLLFSKIRKDVVRFVVCCSRGWRFKG